MPIERETKFLMRDPEGLLIHARRTLPAQEIRQGYVPGRLRLDGAGVAVSLAPDDPATGPILRIPLEGADRERVADLSGSRDPGIPGPIRIRSSRCATGRECAYATFKTGYGDACLEIEAEISLDEAARFVPERGLVKTRFTASAEHGHWDLDLIRRPGGDRLALGIIEREGYPDGANPADGAPDWLGPHLGARIPEAHRDLFSNHRMSDSAHLAGLPERYLLGHFLADTPHVAIAGVTVFHAKFEHARELYDAACGGTDSEMIAGAKAAIRDNHYRAVARFNTDSLEDAMAMTQHGVNVLETWPARYNADRYRFFSPLNRRVEAESTDGSLFTRGGEGFVVTSEPNGQYRFVSIGPVDAEAVRDAYPWP